MRSGIMIIIWLLSKIISKRSDSINSLGIAVFLISMISPNSCLDIGMWLSFLSTLGIVLFADKINVFLKNKILIFNNKNIILNYILSSFCISLSTIITTFALVSWYFRKISLLTFLSNILIIFPVTVLLNFAFIALILGNNIAIWAVLTNRTSDFIIFFVNFLASLPFTSLNLDYPFIMIWIFCTSILIVYVFVFMDFKKEILKISLLSIILLFSGIISYQISLKDKIRLKILCSKNSRSLIISKNNHVIVFCRPEDIYNLRKNLQNINNLDFVISCGEPNESFNNLFLKNYNLIENSGKFISLPDIKNEFLELNFLNNEVNFYIFKIQQKNWLQIKIQNSIFLVCLNGGDVNDLPIELRNCDTLIAFGLPNNFNLINFENILLAMNSYHSRINSQKINNGKIFISDGHDVLIDINIKNGNYVLQRKI
jgi:hypothetical protein